MTRTTDVNVGLKDRSHVARDAVADVFLSIHFNGFDGNVQGTETFVWLNLVPPARSYLLAEMIQEATVAATQYRDRGVKNDQALGVPNPTNHDSGTASCLVEISFMDGPSLTPPKTDEARLSDTAYKDSIAAALADGIEAYLAAPPEIVK